MKKNVVFVGDNMMSLMSDNGLMLNNVTEMINVCNTNDQCLQLKLSVFAKL